MKICVLGSEKRYNRFMSDIADTISKEICYFPIDAKEEEIIKKAGESEVILADAIAPVTKSLIDRMEHLKLVQSEGVAYNRIDTAACKERGIFVCNCEGINKTAVAEQAVLLMLAVLRTLVSGHNAVLDGKQIERKEWLMLNGIRELKGMKVGLVGFGNIARETAKRLNAFDVQIYYTCRIRKSREIEEQYGVTFLSLKELLEQSDIVSLHLPVTDQTVHMADKSFFQTMKQDAYFINTSRGELVENEALKEALLTGTLAGAGLDTIAPEPVEKDNVLLTLPKEAREKLILSPHSAGITTATFIRGHKLIWENVRRIRDGVQPVNVVNAVSLENCNL